ncbi:hypothetical protein KKB18_08815 [bacterium]|nr:hypothetical protein [bacterium]
MRKNQKPACRRGRYSQEEMYLAIEIWKESGMTQYAFCKKENLSTSTFNYWLRKYNKNGASFSIEEKQSYNTFIPVEVSRPDASDYPTSTDRIEILYPNGVQMSCPSRMDMKALRTLIGM